MKRFSICILLFIIFSLIFMKCSNKEEDLIQATKNGNTKIVSKILDQPEINVNIRSEKNNLTPLMLAAKKGKIEIAKSLIKHGAYLNLQNNSGKTAFFIAVENNNTKMVKYLINQDAEINTSNNNGWTPLMVATKMDATKIIELLVENNADISIKNNNGNTVIDIARRRNREEVLKLIEEKAVKKKTAT